jgi:nitrate/nitrite transporter NarK
MAGVIVFTISRHLSYGLNDQLAAHVVMNPFFRDHTSYGAILAMLLFAFGGLMADNMGKHMLVRILSLVILTLLIGALVLSYTVQHDKCDLLSVFCLLSLCV